MTDKITVKNLKGHDQSVTTILPFKIKQLIGSPTGNIVAMVTEDGRLFSFAARNLQETRIVPFASQSVYPLRSAVVSSAGSRIGAIDNAGRFWIEEGKDLSCVFSLGEALHAVISEHFAAVIDAEGLIWVGVGKEKMKQVVPRDKRRFAAIALSSTQLLAITRSSGLLCRFTLEGEEDLHFKNLVIPACSEDQATVRIISLAGTNGDDFIIFNSKAQRLFWLRVGLESSWTKEIELPEGFIFEKITVSIFTMFLTSAEGHVYGINWDHLKDEWLNIWPGVPNLIASDLSHFEATANHSVSVANETESAFMSKKDELLGVMNEINSVRKETSELRAKIKDLRSSTDLPPLPSQKYLLRDALKRKVEEAKLLEEHACTVDNLMSEIESLKLSAAEARENKIILDREIQTERDSAAELEGELHSLISQRDKLHASIKSLRPQLQAVHDELQVIIDSSSKEGREKQLARIDAAIVSITREVAEKKKEAERMRYEHASVISPNSARGSDFQEKLITQWEQSLP